MKISRLRWPSRMGTIIRAGLTLRCCSDFLMGRIATAPTPFCYLRTARLVQAPADVWSLKRSAVPTSAPTYQIDGRIRALAAVFRRHKPPTLHSTLTDGPRVRPAHKPHRPSVSRVSLLGPIAELQVLVLPMLNCCRRSGLTIRFLAPFGPTTRIYVDAYSGTN